MILEPLQKELENLYDKDSFVYVDDNELRYNSGVNLDVVNDIKNKQFQVYNGTYRYKSSWNSPKIYLLGRGKSCGKTVIKIENFLPYCYVKSENGNYKSYLGDTVEKVLFEMQPKAVADFRKRCERNHDDIPYEADIPFVRRLLLDMYDFFKSKEPITPRVAIFDVETNFPVNNNIISFAINSYDGYLYFNSKYQTPNQYSLLLDAYTKIIEYDIITNWNVEFDINILCTKLELIKTSLEILDHNIAMTREEYVKKLNLDLLISLKRANELVEAMIEYNFISIKNDTVVKVKDVNLDLNFLQPIRL